MIIVSQDKNSIYNFSNAKSIDVVKNKVYITDDILSDKGTFIGTYETEKRAKEVLEEIVKKYKDCNTWSLYGVSTINEVYEMPQE